MIVGGGNSKSVTNRGTAFMVGEYMSDKGEYYGLFLSNNHVIHEQSELHVYYHYAMNSSNSPTALDGSNSWNARVSRVIKRDPTRDLALIAVKIPKSVSIKPVNLRVWDLLKEGEINIFAIGNPELTKRTIWHIPKPSAKAQTYISSGKTRSLDQNEDKLQGLFLISHSADILPGNSGGPLIDENGFVIGINSLSTYAPEIKNRPKTGCLAVERYEYSLCFPGMAVTADVIKNFLDSVGTIQ